ncbi:adhesion G protein-coupled receptor B2 [Trichonephila clavipes]|nr:adhesion G protein-coupled receptor B2 [Trichonephila clavipes]
MRSTTFLKIPEGSELANMITNDAKIVKKSPNWPPTRLLKTMPTWLSRQDFAKFSLNSHYNRYRTLNCNKTKMYYSIDMNFFYSKDNLLALHFKYDFWHMTATTGSDVVQSGRPIFDDFFHHLWPYIGNNTANMFFQMVKRLWLIRIDQ